MLLAAGALALACRSTTPPTAPAAPPATRFEAAPLDLRARLLVLEQEKRVDAALLDAASSHGDATVRRAAAHAAGSLADPGARRWLEPLARDPDAHVRAEAAVAFGALADRSAVPTLSALLDDREPGPAAAAARSLGLIGGEEAESAIVGAAAQGKGGRARSYILTALARFSSERSAAAARAAAESAADVGERRAAIYGFARRPRPSSREALVQALGGPDGDAAAFAARGLGILGEAAGAAPLASALARPEPAVQAEALGSIEKIEKAHPGAFPRERIGAVAELASASDANVALPAISALRAFVSDRDAFRILHTQSVSGRGRRREVALIAEAAGLRADAGGRLEEAAESGEESLRAAAAAATAYLPEPSALRDRLLEDPSARVREAAVGAISADAAHRVEIERVLSDSDAGVRSAALDRLAEIRDPAILPAVSQALERAREDGIPDAALSAVAAAASFSSGEGSAALQAALSLPRPIVRWSARRALAARPGADAAALPPVVFPVRYGEAECRAILERAGRRSRARLTTSRGTFVIELDSVHAPLTVRNFVDLARRKFFDGTVIHRVVPAFVVQAGDPDATGHGGPGWEIPDEANLLRYTRGTVGMALQGADTGGSQFFVTLSPQPHLEGRYPVFGRVAAGEDVLERIEQGDRLVSVIVEEAP